MPVWKLSRETGEKGGHDYLYRERRDCRRYDGHFYEIYNDPEQFPIYSVEGAPGAGLPPPGSITAGRPLTSTQTRTIRSTPTDGWEPGSHWTPGRTPGPSPEDGSVVRIFVPMGTPGAGTPGRPTGTTCISPHLGV